LQFYRISIGLKFVNHSFGYPPFEHPYFLSRRTQGADLGVPHPTGV